MRMIVKALLALILGALLWSSGTQCRAQSSTAPFWAGKVGEYKQDENNPQWSRSFLVLYELGYDKTNPVAAQTYAKFMNTYRNMCYGYSLSQQAFVFNLGCTPPCTDGIDYWVKRIQADILKQFPETKGFKAISDQDANYHLRGGPEFEMQRMYDPYRKN